MAYVSVPKDLLQVKSKVMFNLTKRQLTCFTLGALLGFCVYSSATTVMDSSNALTIMILSMFPFFFFAMYEKNGQSLEVILQQVYLVKFGTPKLRPYRSKNFYSKLEEQYNLNMEVSDIVRTTKKGN